MQTQNDSRGTSTLIRTLDKKMFGLLHNSERVGGEHLSFRRRLSSSSVSRITADGVYGCVCPCFN